MWATRKQFFFMLSHQNFNFIRWYLCATSAPIIFICFAKGKRHYFWTQRKSSLKPFYLFLASIHFHFTAIQLLIMHLTMNLTMNLTFLFSLLLGDISVLVFLTTSYFRIWNFIFFHWILTSYAHIKMEISWRFLAKSYSVKFQC